MAEFESRWMELFFLVLAAIGLVFALIVPSAVIGYTLIFVSGYFAGNVLYQRKNNIIFPFYAIVAGFLIGYLIGIQYGNRMIATVFYIVGAFLGYKLHSRGILNDRLY